MNTQWKAAWSTILFVLTLASPANAITIDDFFNDAVVSSNPAHDAAEKVRTAGLVLSINTEAYRNQEAGLFTKVECIYKNFFNEGSLGRISLNSHLSGAQTTNKTADVEDYVSRGIEMYCPSGSGAQVSADQPQYTPTLVRDFFQRIVPNKFDKLTVLNMATSTQMARVRAAGDEDRAKCIRKNLTVGEDIPDSFNTDVLAPLVAAYKSGSATASVEGVIMNAISKNCDNQGK